MRLDVHTMSSGSLFAPFCKTLSADLEAVLPICAAAFPAICDIVIKVVVIAESLRVLRTRVGGRGIGEE